MKGERMHQHRGPHDPLTSTPPQPAGSLRRTTTIDLLRPDGFDGPVILDGRGRDLLVSRAGEHRVIDESGLHGRIDYPGGCRLLELETTPQDDGAQRLLGAAVAGGFRARVGDSLPRQVEERTLLHLLLDDLPGAVVMSGYALFSERDVHDLRAAPEERAAFAAGRRNLCAGFAEDGTMLLELDRTGRIPVPFGPPVPPPTVPDDPAAWHDHPGLPIGGIRRRRRTDVIAAGEVLRVDATFRDTHRNAIDGETIVHEYVLEAVVDRRELRILSIDAEPRVLPWMECPLAARSAKSLTGRTVHDLRVWVRANLHGTSTCTHLNDLLRSLADLDRLARNLTDDPG